jgi:hypothetical protein
LTEKQFNEFVSFVVHFKDYISDIYFTSRIAPFDQDAMGDVFVIHDADAKYSIDAALHIQRLTKIPVSATFNNVTVPPTQRNLDKFIKNFRPLYEAGVRSATIAHTHWVATGKIQAEFPKLFIKNTILREVTQANEVVGLAKAGFHYINLDRDLMRDRDSLLKIMKAKQHCENIGFPVKISLLANEGCAGGCPVMTEHYEYNCNRTKDDPQYFNSPIARVSCQKWDYEDSAIMLKTANFTPWKEDWDELLDLGIDTIKMHGRESATRLYESMDIISKYANNEEILFAGFEEYLEDNNLVEKPINAWRKIIKNCKFDCWDCNFCDKVYESKGGQKLSTKVTKAVEVLAYHDNPTIEDFGIPGLTSSRMQKLIKSIASNSNKYLEVGSFLGSTGVAALSCNTLKEAHFVDHWKEDIQPQVGDELPKTNKETFIENVRKYKGSTACKVYDTDMYATDLTNIKDIDFFFYDGPHDEINTRKAVEYFAETLADEAIIIFDDANWEGVVSGAKAGLAKAKLNVLFEKIWINSVESKDEWWNGFFLVVVKK